ncbi:MAG TPA: PQQ-dependent sugar dehydrogenase [Steroidobacteraceae bacterium]|nr:PQQ-dependent sugar dehydrogenase [Steroidobacteraceae bacterium]
MTLIRIAAFLFACSLPAASFAADSDGLVLPRGFTATVVHDGVGLARHIAIRDNGDLYVTTHQFAFLGFDARKRVGIVALRDSNGDHLPDVVEHFSDLDGTGIAIYKGMLYVSDDVGVYRYRFDGNELLPKQPAETVVGGFPAERTHADKTFTFDNDGHLYVNVGAPSNSCQEQDRAQGSMGQNPCPLLEHYGGIWRFDADRINQTPKDGTRYSTGMRNTIALAWNNDVNALYATIHGRDQLDTIFPKLFTADDNAERVAEEFQRIVEGGDYGWPYAYYDTKLKARVVAPEYGGDGKKRAEAGKYPEPLVAFPAHWAPDDMVFYAGKNFPASYAGGAFIAFHGSWNRAPRPQAGYRVAFVPMKNGTPSGEWQTFADNFTGGALPDNNPNKARTRPVGLAVDSAGALYIVDSEKGRIWRVTYGGS